jgi:hypothetical protein
MKKIIKEILILFIIIVLTNMLIEIGDEQKSYLTKPLRFFGSAVVISIIAGYVTYRIKMTMPKE